MHLIPSSASRRTRRPLLIAGVAVAVGAVLASGGVAAAATPTSVDHAFSLPSTPDELLLHGTFDGPGWASPSVPSSTTSLTFALPDETAAFSSHELRYSLDGGSTLSLSGDVDFDPASRSVTIPVPPDAFAGLPVDGSTHLHFELYNTDPQPLGSGARESLSLSGDLKLVAPDGDAAQSVSLPRAQASSFTYRKSYRLPELQPWLTQADTMTFTLEGGATWSSTSTGLLTSATEERTQGGFGEPTGPVYSGLPLSNVPSADHTSLTEGFSLADWTTSYFGANGFANLHLLSQPTSQPASGPATPEIEVTMLATVAFPTSSSGVASTRISGADRYQGAIAISVAEHKTFSYAPEDGNTVFVASGQNFPDALSAAPVAALAGGSLLLVPPTADDSIDHEIFRLAAHRIVIVGGENSVSSAWQEHLESLRPGEVTRIAGVDRYDASRTLAEESFPEGARTAFIATGATYPDALSAVSAAASVDAPVILVQGTAASLDQPTLDTLDQLGVDHVTIVGGPASVSSGIQTQLESLHPGATLRLGGADRYAASAAVNAHYFATAPRAYLASGANFPDALAGGVLAGMDGAPLLLSQPSCVPAAELGAIAGWGTHEVTVLGGRATISPAAAQLTACS